MSVQQNPEDDAVRFLRLDQVKSRVGMSKTHIYRLIKEGRFPAPLKLSQQISVWPDFRIREWQAEMMRD